MILAPAAHIDVALVGRYATGRIAYRDLLKKHTIRSDLGIRVNHDTVQMRQ
jgi:hypothetical protein